MGAWQKTGQMGQINTRDAFGSLPLFKYTFTPNTMNTQLITGMYALHIAPLNSEQYWSQVPGYSPYPLVPETLMGKFKLGNYIVYAGTNQLSKELFYLDKCTETYGSTIIRIEMHPGLQELALKIMVLGEERWALTFPELMTTYFRHLRPINVVIFN